MKKITGYQRYLLRKTWLKSDRSTEFEAYVKSVCKTRNLIYEKTTYKPRRREYERN